MYKKPVFVAITVLLLVFGVVLICCDNGGFSGVFLPITKSAVSIPPFVGRPVVTTDEAKKLLDLLRDSNFADTLDKAWYTAYNNAFSIKYGSYPLFEQSVIGKKSFSHSVKIDKDGGPLLIAEANKITPNNVLAATMKGNNKYSWSSNYPYNPSTTSTSGNVVPPDGTTQSVSSSESREYNISGGSYQETIGSTTLSVAGVVTVKTESTSKYTYNAAKTTPVPTDAIYQRNSSSKSSRTVTLSISDGTMGGKFIFSEAGDYISKGRAAEMKGGSVSSNIEVYDNSGKKIVTLNGSYDLDSIFSGRSNGSAYDY